MTLQIYFSFEKEVILRFATFDFVTAFNEILETPNHIEANKLIVYLNPNNGNCKIYMENKGFKEIQLFNISGIEIPIINNLIISNHYSKYLSLNGLPKGIYIIKAIDQFNNSYQEKIIVY